MKNYIKNTQKINSILFIISSLSTGGAERVVSELCNYFCEKNISVSLLLLSRCDVNYEINKNVRIIFGCNEIKEKCNIIDFISRVNIIKKYVKIVNPDITISFLATINIYSCLALGFSKNRLIVSERNDPQKSPPEKIKRIVRDTVYYLSDGYVFQTHEAKKYFSSIIRSKSVVIYNPIKSDLPKVFDGTREKKIVAVGRLEEQKNYPLLIKAFKLISNDFKDYIVEIYGEGKKRDELLGLISKLNLDNRVFLMGRKDNVHQCIRRASLFVMSSIYEGMPNALMEAMALGLPCISTDCSCGGPKSLISNGINGILVPINDEHALSEQIAHLLLNEEYRDQLSNKASSIRNTLSIDVIGDKWLNFMALIIGDIK